MQSTLIVAAISAAIIGFLFWQNGNLQEELGAVTAKANSELVRLTGVAAEATTDARMTREREKEFRDKATAHESEILELRIQAVRLTGEINANRQANFMAALADPVNAADADADFFDRRMRSIAAQPADRDDSDTGASPDAAESPPDEVSAGAD